MVDQLDLDTVIKVLQAVSGEIVREKVIDTLMRTAVEHAGAERGLLILTRGVDQRIEAEAKAEKSPGSERVTVRLRQASVTAGDLPESLFHYVVRTQESVILDDASARNPFSSDDYIRQNHARSVLCLPLVKQAKLIGVLYLENNLTPDVFTPARIAVLKLLASQAAISLENANLYSDLQRSEAAIRASEKSLRLIIDTIPGFMCTLNAAGEVELLNRQVLEYFGKTAEELKNWTTSDAVHPDDLPRVIDAWRRSVETGQPYVLEFRQRRADGVYRWFQSRALPARDAEGRITGWYMLLTDIDERKKAEEKLQRSEAFLAQAQSISHTGSFGWSVSNGEILWSEETFRIFQYDPTTKPSVALVLQRTHPDDAAFVKQSIERASQDEEDFDFEHRLLMPDSSIKHVRVVGHAERDELGQLEFVGAVMDVTAAKEAEERIRQDERELRITLDTIPASVTSTLPDGSVDFVSQSWLDYVGCSREEILGWGWKTTIHPEDLDRVLNNWQAASAAGEPLEIELRHRRPDSKYRWFLTRVVPLRDEKGNIVKWYATTFDIEDRKRAEEALRRSEAYLAEAQRLTHTGSWAHNVATGETTHASEEFSRLYGFDPDRGVPSDREFRQRIHQEDLDRVVETYERAVVERTDFEMDYRIVLPDGTIKYLHAMGHPVFNAAGDLVEYIGSNVDVTERKRAEDALQKAQAELAHVARVATLGEMTASISHEINQPLGAVVNSASACLRWLAASKLEEARLSASRVISEGHRASEIIARIRALAKKAPHRRDWLDINETIHEVIVLARSEVKRSGVVLETQLSDDVPAILADRIELQQVILNLMINAIEAMSGAGEGPRELLVRSVKDESQGVLISVQDSGPGLDPESLDHLFDAFYTTKPEGLGMGLAISRSLIEAHRGRLWATANAPHGAIFQFTLPTGGERTS